MNAREIASNAWDLITLVAAGNTEFDVLEEKARALVKHARDVTLTAPLTSVRERDALEFGVANARRIPTGPPGARERFLDALYREFLGPTPAPELIHEVDLGKHGDGENIGMTSLFAAKLQEDGIIYTRQCISQYALNPALDDEAIAAAVRRILDGD